MTECFFLDDNGKVIPGKTVLRDPQTGQLFDVVSVMTGDMETGPRPFRLGSSAEKCSLFGDSISRERERRQLEVSRLNKPGRIIPFPVAVG